ncbi:SET domain-containing protein-lysine N-methyltransferase [Simkania negevensis]|uniref:SET domain-containing protein-lysine N-methyltransferase n=1 Tax=Simkania negevensis TaxID=83561 RepID=A0ABS3AQL2_9BACT|nr:SET domain-containing protein-lysine N-methyltransferase [Simkania negevensis]
MLYLYDDKTSSVKPLPVAEVEQRLSFHYLSHIVFEDERILEKINDLCRRVYLEWEINREKKWLAAFYKPHIDSLYFAPVYIKWIGVEAGYGLFARKPIPPSSYIGEYTGVVRRWRWLKAEENNYRFRYQISEYKRPHFFVDAEQSGNYARFINHSEMPNIEAVTITYGPVARIIFRSLQYIAPDEQIVLNYGKSYWKRRPSPQKF